MFGMTGSDPLPTLPAERLVLRELTAGDAAEVLASFSNREVVRFTNIDPLETLAEAKSWIAGVRAERDSRAVLHWGIARLLDDRILGTCKLFHLEPKHRRAEVGFALGREHWGKGYAAEALTVLFDFAFGPLALHRLEADVDPRNTSSLKTLERLGFRVEGHLRERYFIGGEIQDALMLGLLKREWEAVRAASRSVAP